MSPELIVFWILAIGTVAGALAVVVPPMGRNPLHGALALVVSFIFMAGLYVQLSASFVAVVQVLVYAGAVMTLFVFVIMLLNLTPEELRKPKYSWYKALSVLAAVVLGIVMVLGVAGATKTFHPANLTAGFGNAAGVGETLVKKWLFVFEFSSILLLAAIVGAVAVARKRRAE
jgi:NADH-quinone oxidoreductase subunit J